MRLQGYPADSMEISSDNSERGKHSAMILRNMFPRANYEYGHVNARLKFVFVESRVLTY
jgi:hypothetical protein